MLLANSPCSSFADASVLKATKYWQDPGLGGGFVALFVLFQEHLVLWPLRGLGCLDDQTNKKPDQVRAPGETTLPETIMEVDGTALG